MTVARADKRNIASHTGHVQGTYTLEVSTHDTNGQMLFCIDASFTVKGSGGLFDSVLQALGGWDHAASTELDDL